MQIEWTTLHAWCDSQITITWIQGEPEGWKTYVANRVVEIHENVSSGIWHYIRSAQNPADTRQCIAWNRSDTIGRLETLAEWSIMVTVE